MEKIELIVELGVEEIPASMIEGAANQFADLLTRALSEQRLSTGERTVWYTPRRIIVGLKDIPDRQENLVETVVGPPKSIGYDASGAPTKAAAAFAQKNGVPLAKIKIVQTPKGEYLSIARSERGEKTRKLLESLIPEAIRKIQFPKTMHWSPDQFRFTRPLRWIVALFGGKVVRFRLADVESSNLTTGHRFLGKSGIRVSSLDLLKDQLRENSVLIDADERLDLISTGLNREASAAGGRLLNDPDLIKTVVNLNEAPSIVRGSFETRFLDLPQEILVTVMREHQKYFSVLSEAGQLLPAFLAVVNLHSDSSQNIRTGHERVLRARLADAAFFWDTDRKNKLGNREESLKSVLFQEKLGSYYDKALRVLSMMPRTVQALGCTDLLADLETAGRMFKCDLITEMVKEFTDLQGVVGGLYARAEGFNENVWRAIYEQYCPKSTNSPSPSAKSGALLALLDRLDTVCGCFSIGLIPSGSGDPFAVRRQGNGIIKIIFDHRLSIFLSQLIQWSLESFGKSSEQTTQTTAALREFFEGRIRFLFEEMGFAYDCVNAVLAAGFDDPLDALERLKALQEMREQNDFLSLASNFKRVVNIISQSGNDAGAPDESLLKESAEMELWRAYLQVQPEVESARKRHDYKTALISLASMRNVVDEFFRQVMVMAEDPEVRKNRISLLNCISRLFKSVADISRMVIEKSA
jgi:glycyl-tRNA synthetase beta chain